MKNLLSRLMRPRVADTHIDGRQGPVPLDVRIEHMLSESVPFDPDHFQTPAIRNAVAAIGQSGYAIRVDNFRDQKVSESIGRLGIAVFSEKHPPLIYLILGLNPNDIELADTIFHEAMHCTAQALGRHVILPEDDNTGEAWLEELCVYSGLCQLYPKLHIPEMRQIHRRNKDRHNMLKQKLATGIPVEHVDLWDRHGIDAAEHLYALIRNHS